MRYFLRIKDYSLEEIRNIFSHLGATYTCGYMPTNRIFNWNTLVYNPETNKFSLINEIVQSYSKIEDLTKYKKTIIDNIIYQQI